MNCRSYTRSVDFSPRGRRSQASDGALRPAGAYERDRLDGPDGWNPCRLEPCDVQQHFTHTQKIPAMLPTRPWWIAPAVSFLQDARLSRATVMTVSTAIQKVYFHTPHPSGKNTSPQRLSKTPKLQRFYFLCHKKWTKKNSTFFLAK